MTRVLLAFALCIGSSACESKPTGSPSPEKPANSTTATGGKSTKLYGAALGSGQKAELATVLAKPDDYANKNVIVEGEVRRACTRKGCWMEIAERTDKAAVGARVTFKDYGFFAPLDSAGAHAKLEGTVAVETLKAAHVEHLESEGAKVANKNPDGTAREVQFVATGVELTK
jgi:hypothetical protein